MRALGHHSNIRIVKTDGAAEYGIDRLNRQCGSEQQHGNKKENHNKTNHFIIIHFSNTHVVKQMGQWSRTSTSWNGKTGLKQAQQIK